MPRDPKTGKFVPHRQQGMPVAPAEAETSPMTEDDQLRAINPFSDPLVWCVFGAVFFVFAILMLLAWVLLS